MPLAKNIAVACAIFLLSNMFYVRNASADETIYKSVGPNGEVTYALHPEANAVCTEKIRVETLSPEQQRAVKQFQLSGKKAESEADAYLKDLEDRWQQADQEIIDALAEVEQTETALQQGRTPLPGERSATAGGGNRLTENYFDRIHQLELAVQQAKQRLERAYQARNALK